MDDTKGIYRSLKLALVGYVWDQIFFDQFYKINFEIQAEKSGKEDMDETADMANYDTRANDDNTFVPNLVYKN